jgi:hypothetical protein
VIHLAHLNLCYVFVWFICGLCPTSTELYIGDTSSSSVHLWYVQLVCTSALCIVQLICIQAHLYISDMPISSVHLWSVQLICPSLICPAHLYTNCIFLFLLRSLSSVHRWYLYSTLVQLFLTVLLFSTLSIVHKEVLQKESGHCLCYIYSRWPCMELFQLQVAPLVFKFGIYQGQTGSEEWWGRGKEWEGRKPV